MAYFKCSLMKIATEPGSLAPLLAAIILAAGGSALVTGCGGESNKSSQTLDEQLYTCGMHPQVIQNKPGNCPICGMKLTPVRKQAGQSGATGSAQRTGKFYK